MRMDYYEVCKSFEEFSYEDKCKFYSKFFSAGYLNTNAMTPRLALISLLGVLTIAFRKKKSNMTCLEVMEKVIGEDLMQLPKEFIEGVCVSCESFLYGCKEADKFGLKTADEIAAKIKEILSSFMPF